MGRILSRWIVGVLLLSSILAASASPAAAAPAPGTPIAVAPAVPSHGRAWELVSFPQSTPSSTLFFGASLLGDGDVFLYRQLGPMPGYPLNEPLAPPVRSVRRPDGWNPVQAPSPHPEILNGTVNFPVAFGPGNETAIWSNAYESGIGLIETSLFLEDRTGAFTPLIERAGFIAASPDLQRMIVSGHGHFVAADASRTEGGSIYELVGSSLRLLDVAGDGSLISDCGSTGKAVSTDLTRVYFTTRPGCTGSVRVYLAEGASAAREVSTSRCTSACGAPADVTLLDATPSGSDLLLRTAEKLTDDDVNDHLDLYRYSLAGNSLSLLSSGPGGPDLVPVANPLMWRPSAWQSTDGSRAYFVAAESTGPGTTGEPGIYLADQNGTRLFASTAAVELIDVSASGRYALLNTSSPLEPGDTDGEKDVYRYDATADTFERISKGPLGGNGPLQAGADKDRLLYEGLLPGQHSRAQESGEPGATGFFRAMSEDGSRIFFVTGERLVAGDTNGLEDVYEWANGDVGLVSSGAGKSNSTLMTTTPDGRTVIFKTGDTLLPRDRDSDDADYYAARIGGGFDESSVDDRRCPCTRSAPARQAIDRRETASAKAAGGRIALRRPGARERRGFARSGWIALLVEVPSAGRLSVEARARLGGRMRTVASTLVAVDRPGSVQVRVRLSRAARAHLSGGGDLRIGIRLGLLRKPDANRTVSFELEGAR